MTPSISTEFKLSTLKAKVSDIFNYTTLVYSNISGNVTAKIGSTIFHTNTDFGSGADIVIGTNTFVEFDLPLNDAGEVREAGYEFIYDVKIYDEVLYNSDVDTGFIPATVAASPITEVVLGTPDAAMVIAVEALLAQGLDVRVEIYDSGDNPLGDAEIISLTAGIITCAGIAYTGTVTQMRIIGTNTYQSTFDYDFCNEMPEPTLCVEANCYYATLQATDTTQYKAGSELTRILKIQYPRLANGTSVLPSVTTVNSTYTIGPPIYSGNFTITLNVDVSYVQDDSLIVSESLEQQVDYLVNCDANLCCLRECIYAINEKYRLAVRQGSRDILQLSQQVLYIQTLMSDYMLAVRCLETTLAQSIFEELSLYIKANKPSSCNCGCGESENQGVPTVIYPLFSSGE